MIFLTQIAEQRTEILEIMNREMFEEVVPSEEIAASLMRVAKDELCPYNYEAISVLLKQMNKWLLQGVATDSQPFLKDALTLLDFLKWVNSS